MGESKLTDYPMIKVKESKLTAIKKCDLTSSKYIPYPAEWLQHLQSDPMCSQFKITGNSWEIFDVQ